jgi:uncharacterized protein (TIGR02453 family)
MLQPQTLEFLNRLKENNSKEWFDQHRKQYDSAKTDVVNLVQEVLVSLELHDPAIAASQLKAKSCLFRINRDVRFSANKSPYKTNFGAWLNAGGKKSASAGYYLNIEPGRSFIAGGMYMPESAVLVKIREEIDYNLLDFEALLAKPSFQKVFKDISRENTLIRPPKGYEADNPAIDYLKLKSFTASHQLTDGALTSPDLAKIIVSAFAGLQPLVEFLNKGLVQAE